MNPRYRAAVDLRFPTPPPDGITIAVDAARVLPVDWYRWRDSVLAGAPLSPIVEGYTEPAGWSVTIVFVATPDGMRAHAFYAVFDTAVHASALLPAEASAELQAHVHLAFTHAVPVFPDHIVALGDL